jgi:hypothetical protein
VTAPTTELARIKARLHAERAAQAAACSGPPAQALPALTREQIAAMDEMAAWSAR